MHLCMEVIGVISVHNLQELLDDPSVMVRVVTVAGVCRVLSYYWEMIPAPVIKTLLGRLVKDLAWDASAINVRVAVLQVYFLQQNETLLVLMIHRDPCMSKYK